MGCIRHRIRLSRVCSGNKKNLAWLELLSWDGGAGRANRRMCLRSVAFYPSSLENLLKFSGVQTICLDKSMAGVEHGDPCGRQEWGLVKFGFGLQRSGDRPC